MNRLLRNLGLAAAVAGALPLAGCFEKAISDHNPLGILFIILQGGFSPELTVAGKSPVTKTKVDTVKEVYFDAEVGGLSGTYDVTFTDGDGKTYGSFSGTTAVKRGRFITIKDSESEGLFSMVASIVAEQAGGSVVLEKVKAKVSAYQTPGGVSVVYKAKITFKGTVADGPYAGARLRAGKLVTAGVYPKL